MIFDALPIERDDPRIDACISVAAAGRMLAFAQTSPHIVEMGVEVTRIARSECRVRMVPKVFMLADPEAGLLHPGALFSLADTACGVAVMATLGDLQPIATLDLRVDHLRPATLENVLEVRARCTQRSAHIVFVEGEVIREHDGVPVSKILGTFIAPPKEPVCEKN